MKNDLFQISKLVGIQGALAITPVLVTPYIAIKLGPQSYSIYAVVLNAIALCAALSDFGIQQRATEVFASSLRSKSSVGAFHVNALTLRLIVALISAATSIFYLQSIHVGTPVDLFLIAICVIFQALAPLWIYFGSARYDYLFVLIAVSRVVFTLFVLIALYFVPSYSSVLVAFCSMHAIVSIGALIHSRTEIGSLSQASIRGTFRLFRESLDYFLSRLSVLIVNFAPIILLSFEHKNEAVAYFSIAQLIYFSCQAIVAPFGQFSLNEMYRSYRPKFIFSAAALSALAALIPLSIFTITGPEFISFIFGYEFGAAHSIVVALSVAFVFHAPSVFLGFPLMAPADRAYIANRSMVVAILSATTFGVIAFSWGLPLEVFLPWCVVVFEASAFAIRLLGAVFLKLARCD